MLDAHLRHSSPSANQTFKIQHKDIGTWFTQHLCQLNVALADLLQPWLNVSGRRGYCAANLGSGIKKHIIDGWHCLTQVTWEPALSEAV